jgi:hypothetical protein
MLVLPKLSTETLLGTGHCPLCILAPAFAFLKDRKILSFTTLRHETFPGHDHGWWFLTFGAHEERFRI